MNHNLKARQVPRQRPQQTVSPCLLLALLAFSIFPTQTHATPQSSDQLYEGLKVSRVVLIAAPSVNVGEFQALVAQKAGATYSEADIDKTVVALQRTGKFTRVDVEILPQADGLRINFILEPVFYIGTITFPGAVKEFSYPRLLQTVNYPAQEPYEAARATRGVTSLTQFLAQQGYFRAQVVEETKLEPDRKLANLVYNVTLGPRAKFGNIQINGPAPAEVAQLKACLTSLRARLHGADVRRGKPFLPDHLQAATNFLQDFLGKQHYLANRVKMNRPAYDRETNRTNLSWDVTLGSTVEVRVEGASVSTRSLKKLIPVYEENAFDDDLVEEGRRNLVSYFQGKGYFDAKVTAQTSEAPSKISLVYQVERGDRHSVASVRITGNRRVDANGLWGQVMVEKARFLSHGKYNNDLLTRSVNNLTAYYHNAGYHDVQVKPQVTDREEKLSVTFQITEGERTIVSALNLEGNATQTSAALAPKGLNLKPGQPYSQARLDKDRSAIIAKYLELGYPNATLKWSVKPAAGGDPHHVDVTYTIDEGPQVRISSVEYVGQVHTRLPFIEHNTSVKAGAPLSEDKVLGSESSLYNLGIFDWASVAPRTPITDQSSEDVLVRVHEEKRNSLTYGVGLQYTPVDGSLSSGIVALPGLPTLGLPSAFKPIEKTVFSPLGSIQYSRLNVLGRAETASVGAYVSILDQRGNFSYTDPQFLGLTWSSLLNLSAERTSQNPLFEARLGTASFQLEKALNTSKTERLQIRYAFQRTSLTNLLIQNFIPPDDLSVRSSMFSATFIRDTRDNPLDAHRGFFETADFGVSPKVLGSTDNFARFFGQAAYYRRMTPWLVWANDVRLGLVDSFAGSHVPISEQYFSGGADSLRGFPLNGAGPQVLATLCTKANDPTACKYEITAPAGGHELFIFNSEGRFPLPIYKGLGGVLFYDGGNVYKTIGFSHFLSDYSNTVGVGVRYQTPVGPIRIDVGHNLNPVPGLHATQLFITLGQSF